MFLDSDKPCKSLLRLSIRNNRLGANDRVRNQNTNRHERHLRCGKGKHKAETGAGRIGKGKLSEKLREFSEGEDSLPAAESTRYETSFDTKFRFDLVPNLQVLHAEFNPGLRLAEIVAGFTGSDSVSLLTSSLLESSTPGSATLVRKPVVSSALSKSFRPTSGNSSANKIAKKETSKHGKNGYDDTKNGVSAGLKTNVEDRTYFKTQTRRNTPKTTSAAHNKDSKGKIGPSSLVSSLVRSTKAGDRKERTAVKTTSSTGNSAVLGLVRKAKARNTIEQELLAASKTCSLRHLSIHISCEEDLVLFANSDKRIQRRNEGDAHSNFRFSNSVAKAGNSNTMSASKVGENEYSDGTNILTFFNEIQELKFFAWPTISKDHAISTSHGDYNMHKEECYDNSNDKKYYFDSLNYTFQLSTYFLNLKLLDLSGQGIARLSPTFAELVPNLRVANFAFNKLGDEDLVTVFCKIPRLARLFLYGNQIKRVKSVIQFLQYTSSLSVNSGTAGSMLSRGSIPTVDGDLYEFSATNESNIDEEGIEGHHRVLQILDLRNNPVTEGFYPDLIQVQRSQEEMEQKETRSEYGMFPKGWLPTSLSASGAGESRDGGKDNQGGQPSDTKTKSSQSNKKKNNVKRHTRQDGCFEREKGKTNKILLLCELLEALQMPSDPRQEDTKEERQRGERMFQRISKKDQVRLTSKEYQHDMGDVTYETVEKIEHVKSSSDVYQEALKTRGQQVWQAADSAYFENLIRDLDNEEAECDTGRTDSRIEYWGAILISCPGLKWLDGHVLTETVCKSVVRAWRQVIS